MAIKTFTSGEVLTAADTNAYLANSGLTYVASATLSGTTTSLSNIFTSTYKNYKITVTTESSVSSTNIFFKLRDSGGDNSTGYSFGFWLVDASGTVNASSASANSALINIAPTATGTAITEFILSNPAVAGITTGFAGNSAHFNVGGARTNNFGGSHFVSAAFTGISIISSADITGNIRVYGFREP